MTATDIGHMNLGIVGQVLCLLILANAFYFMFTGKFSLFGLDRAFFMILSGIGGIIRDIIQGVFRSRSRRRREERNNEQQQPREVHVHHHHHYHGDGETD